MRKILILIITVSFASCKMSVSDPSDLYDYKTNFEALWKIMDEHYCYFTYKNINWDSIGNVYRAKMQRPDTLNDVTFFNICGNMLAELKDGHVNLASSFNVARYWAWYLDYPDNFNSDILYSDRYLGKNYYIAGGFNYNVLPKSAIGYIYYGDFSTGFSDANLSYAIGMLANCQGLIIDVRNNSGGVLTYTEDIAARFTTQSFTYGYIKHKTGTGHNDFSAPIAQTLTPFSATATILNWVKKPVVVLTNRECYSATNAFVSIMKELPNVVIIGDETGGGGGLPMNSELPNGWMVRYSACPMFDENMQNIDFGISPTIKVDMSDSDIAKGVDTIIETAITYLNQHKVN